MNLALLPLVAAILLAGNRAYQHIPVARTPHHARLSVYTSHSQEKRCWQVTVQHVVGEAGLMAQDMCDHMQVQPGVRKLGADVTKQVTSVLSRQLHVHLTDVGCSVHN